MTEPDIRPEQSPELLKALHILTRDGKLNQDSRRKLKQVYHLHQFIEPLLKELSLDRPDFSVVDHGAGKSYLGFILVDLYLRHHAVQATMLSIESRPELVTHARELANKLGFTQMRFLNQTVAQAIASDEISERIDMVTALHACNTATDDAIRFGLAKHARYMVLVPCCQAEEFVGEIVGASTVTHIAHSCLDDSARDVEIAHLNVLVPQAPEEGRPAHGSVDGGPGRVA
jgi:hypothetical protein